MPDLSPLFPLGVSHYLAGGLLIGLAVSLLFVTTGLVGGMSTVFSSSWSWLSKLQFFQQPALIQSRLWRLCYAVGLILGGGAFVLFSGAQTSPTSVSGWQLLIGGFVAGFGARLSRGCTSGHGICGLASLQLPSLLAVLIFMGAAMVSAALVRLAGGV